MRTFQAIGTAVYYIDSGEPYKEPRKATEMVDGDARVSRLQLCYCRDGCGKYFTAMFTATLCATCENTMRAAVATEYDSPAGYCTECGVWLANDAAITCDDCMYDIAGKRGEDW